MKPKINSKKVAVVLCVGLIVEIVLEFLFHRKVVFIKDDLWYASNLATGAPLSGLGDIWESQVWHFMNWGGRSITHGLLQLLLMSGTLFADICNMAVTLTLVCLICAVAGKKSWFNYCLASFMLISLNATVELSMFWQSGSVNYLYSTNWILLFLLCYLKAVREKSGERIRGIIFWIAPLGLITGWSNENMGPACCLLSLMAIFYFTKILKKKAPAWMCVGAVSSFVGSVLVICAPGNFVRSSLFEEMSLGEMLYEKFVMMLSAGAGFLFPSAFFLLIFGLIYFKKGLILQPFQIMLLITAVLAYGAMVLSPTFPSRATFGIMVLFLVLILTFIEGILERDSGAEKYVLGFAFCMWLVAIYTLAIILSAPLER